MAINAIETLVQDKVASRLHARDYSLYDFDDNALDFATNYTGWVDLASNPPVPISEITDFAEEAWANGINSVYVIAMGGSSQAPMTTTKYHKPDGNKVKVRVLDSDSPVRLRKALCGEDFKHALVIVASKSGGTLEPRMILSAVRDMMEEKLSKEEIPQHLLAITDPGSNLEKQAQTEGWLKIFSGEPTVGGRFSGLSVFGLVPTALSGIDMKAFMDNALKAEQACSTDSVDNPAVKLGAFLYENYAQGRDKFCFVAPQRGRALGLWVEQLVAESLGKTGKGILPSLEVDPSLQTGEADDRVFITYTTKQKLNDEALNYAESLKMLCSDVPRMDFTIGDAEEISEHFIMWEYAVAMCGYLMKVSPFDQPDVQSAKTEVVQIIADGMPEPSFTCEFIPGSGMGKAEVSVSSVLPQCSSVEEAVKALVKSITPGSYFAIEAFLPFEGEGRTTTLESIRHDIAEATGVVSNLEIGPRFLHSSGQLYKGGPNTGVFLVVSADELDDIELHEDCKTLGNLAKAQAVGDWLVLDARDRRAIHLHLPNNSAAALRELARMVRKALEEK